jgi:hypothetical protein
MARIPRLSIALRSSGLQYLIGLSINCLYLFILFSSNTSYRNIQLPIGTYSENLWKGTDVLTYVGPARNFLEYRIFGFGTTPDYRRSIGYPFFLSSLMMLFGTHWIMFAWFVQAALFALIYPLLLRISTLLLNSNDNAVIVSFLFLIVSGTYIVRVPVLLTDTFFTVLFTLGLWLGLESVKKKLQALTIPYNMYRICCPNTSIASPLSYHKLPYFNIYSEKMRST